MKYDINLNVSKKAKDVVGCFLVGVIFFLLIIGGQLLTSSDIPVILILISIVLIVLMVLGILAFVKINKRIKMFDELIKSGKLIKNIPYRLEDTGETLNDVPLMKIIVDYQLPNGNVVKLVGSASGTEIAQHSDGLIDLLIDENNPDNYYIRFDINRVGGNLPTDYSNYGKENGDSQNNSF